MKNHFILPLFFCLFAVTSSSGQAGMLDSDFGQDGIVPMSLGGITRTSAMVVQPDNNILLGGSHRLVGERGNFFLARYRPDGTPDYGFGDNGTLISRIGEFGGDLLAMAVQPDGKIIAVGGIGTSQTPSNNLDVVLVRYTSNGTIDYSFNATGIVVTKISDRGEYANAVAVQEDGKIVIGGRISRSVIDFDVFTARYTADGQLDTTFNSTGMSITTFGDDGESINALAIQPDGKILAGGYATIGDDVEGFTLFRYLEDGTYDTDFGTGGKNYYAIGDDAGIANAIQLLSDGKILLGGYAIGEKDIDFAMMRILPNGEIDGAFGRDGRVLTDFGDGNDYAVSMIEQLDKKIVLAGRTQLGNLNKFGLARYTANGDLEEDFGTSGKVVTDLGYISSFTAVGLQKSGKIIAAGMNRESSSASDNMTVARYLSGLDTDLSVFAPGNPFINCTGETATFDLFVGYGFDSIGVDLQIDNLPSGAIVNYSSNPALPGELVSIELTGLGNFSTLDFTVSASDASAQNSRTDILIHNLSIPVNLSQPTNNALQVDLIPQFEWQAINSVKEYQFELVSDTSDILNSLWYSQSTQAISLNAPDLTLLGGQDYFWRVKTVACGSVASEWYKFTTQELTGLSFNTPHKSISTCYGDLHNIPLQLGNGFDPAGVNLSIEMAPPGAVITFSTNPALLGAVVDMNINGLIDDPFFTIKIKGEDNQGNTASLSINFFPEVVINAISDRSPVNNELDVEVSPTFFWDSDLRDNYQIEIATDALDFSGSTFFSDVFENARFYDLPIALDSFQTYYWRILSKNDCYSLPSDIYAFTTGLPQGYFIATSSDQLRGCRGVDYHFELEVGFGMDPAGVLLEVTGVPAGGEITIGSNPAMPGEKVKMILSGDIVNPFLLLKIDATPVNSGRSLNTSLSVFQDVPVTDIEINSPVDGQTAVSTSPVLDWEGSFFQFYVIRVATDSSDFEGTLLLQDTFEYLVGDYVLPTVLDLNQTYFWKVSTLIGCGNSEVFAFTTSTTGTIDLQPLIFSLSPNPTDGFLQFHLPEQQKKESQLILRDAQGIRHKSWTLQPGQSQLAINEKGLSGLYFLTLIADQKISTQKVIFQ